MDFKNKVVLITGASSGIGKQTAIEFAKLGSIIILVARRKDKLEQLEKELKKFNVTTLVCECDISKKTQVEIMSKIVIYLPVLYLILKPQTLRILSLRR